MDMLKDERFDFTILENDIVRDTEKYNKNELLAYIAISYHADKAGTCFPSYEGIARIMRTSRTTAINAIQGLVEKGVIKLENRKSDEKKNEMTSNLYTLVSNKFWEQTVRENRAYLAKKGVEYKKRYNKGQATKIANRNAKLLEEEKMNKKNTPDSTAIESDVNFVNTFNKSFDKSIIPQENTTGKHKSIDKTGQNMTNDQEMSDALKQRLDLLKNAGIKYVPFKTDADMIESLDLDMLKQAIDKTVEQSDSRSWKYLLSVYDTESVKKFRAEKNQNNGSYNNNNNHKPNGGYSRYSKQYGGRSKIGDKYVDEYTPEEFDKMLKEMQRRKWGTKSAV